MIKRGLKTGLMAATAAAMTITAWTTVEAAETWKIQSLWQPGTVNQKVFVRFAENVKAMTKGRLVITPMPVKSVVGHTETLEAVGADILQGQHSGGAYFAGKEPGLQICTELNGAFETTYQSQLWFEYGGGTELCREAYAKFNVFYVGPVWFGQESMPAKNRLETVASFKGVKMRAPEGMGAAIWRRIGAGVVTLPGSEVFTALERGVIDATDWGTLGMNQDLGYHKIAPFPLYPGFHSAPAADVAINMKRWNGLSADVKAIMVTATKEFARDMVQSIIMVDIQAAEDAVKQGATLVNWSAEERTKFRKIAMIEWDVFANKSPMARKLVDSQVAFLRKLKLVD
jgi:TRAP-type mannitol/chloroaromatic compound transport system substrate-binding protein|tara:strand:+ start:432 stop:1460 length:1029 start_codon:yes stop_codon:yes gene_type:complete